MIDVLSDPDALADIREADQAYARGDVVCGDPQCAIRQRTRRPERRPLAKTPAMLLCPAICCRALERPDQGPRPSTSPGGGARWWVAPRCACRWPARSSWPTWGSPTHSNRAGLTTSDGRQPASPHRPAGAGAEPWPTSPARRPTLRRNRPRSRANRPALETARPKAGVSRSSSTDALSKHRRRKGHSSVAGSRQLET